MSRTHLALLTGLLLLFSCSKESEDKGPLPGTGGRRVFVVCEGAYGNGNSALTLHLPDSGRTIADAFAQANGRGLGDVFQSMTAVPGTSDFLLCINNSDRISFVEKTTLLETGNLSIPKPRYAVPLSPDRVYVSSLFNNKIYLLNPQSRTITQSIELPYRNPEGMVLNGARLWVATWDTATAHIYGIDTSSNRIVDSMIVAGRAPQEILLDREGMMWVLSGNDAQHVGSRLTRLRSDGSMAASYDFGPAVAMKPVFNATHDTLYFLEVAYNGGSSNNGVYRMDIHASALPATPFVAASGLQYFWAVGVQPGTGRVFVADPKGFTQKGFVRVYQPDGSAVDSFATGVGPGHFYFDD